jgi:tetratricopeptide (TPR) repeat protein
MRTIDWPSLVLDDGVLREPSPGDDRLILWLRGRRQDGYQYWERLSSVVGAPLMADAGLCAVSAASILARRRVGGVVGALLKPFRKAPTETTWSVPDGTTVEEAGERKSDLALVWFEREDRSSAETRIRARWPASRRVQRVAGTLFVIDGVSPPGAEVETELVAAPQGCPHAQTERLLAAARAKADRRAEVAALTDLGIIFVRERNPRQALEHLEEALTIARALQDPSLETDVLNHLGLAARSAGQFQRAFEVLELALRQARQEGNRYAEKTSLFHLGLTLASMNLPERALGYFTHALTLARAVGDRRHVVELLWYMSIRHAELNQRELAMARAQEAVNLLRQKGDPQADWFDHHLRQYIQGKSAPGMHAEWLSAAPYTHPNLLETSFDSLDTENHTGGGFLSMAFTAAGSMARFLGSGLKGVSRVTYHQRLETCGSCQHHTGVRCRLCGCFTNVKAWMPHEECPAGKWPIEAVIGRQPVVVIPRSPSKSH